MLHIKATTKRTDVIEKLPDERLTLVQMQKLVGGPIEFVWPRNFPSIMFVVNEEGHPRNLPENVVGTRLYGYAPGIVGDIIVVTRVEYNSFIRHRGDPSVPVDQLGAGRKLLDSIMQGTF